MACFIVPAAEAAVTTVATKIMRSRETQRDALLPQEEHKIPFSRKLGWLSKLLWGGSGLLAFEHLWHGEVTPWFPFLTAAADPASAMEMLHEMATTGVAMAVLASGLWLAMTGVASLMEKRATKAPADAQEGA